MITQADEALVAAATRVIEENEDGVIHTVGAAVRDATGAIHVGVNVYHFLGGPCAELVALGVARSAGARMLETIVAVGNNGRGVLAPCGRDRQVLLDYHPTIRVIVPTSHATVSVPVADLLPHAYQAHGPGAGAS